MEDDTVFGRKLYFYTILLKKVSLLFGIPCKKIVIGIIIGKNIYTYVIFI